MQNQKIMNVFKKINPTLFIVILLFFSISAFGQKIEPKKRILEPDHTIASKIMGKDYQLYISFPASYSTKDAISYPVLYVLDGRPNFSMLRGIQNVLGYAGEIEEVIIVAIGSGLDIPS